MTFMLLRHTLFPRLARRLRDASLLALVMSVIALAGSCRDEVTAPTYLGPVSFVVVSGGGQSGLVGTELPAPLVVQATDSKGKALRGVTVTFRVTSGGGSVYAGTSTTDKDGIAQDYWTLGTSAAEPQQLEVRAVLATGQKQVYGVFAATALAGPAAQITVKAGNGQSAAVNAAVAIAPSVLVGDAFNNPISGVSVTFTVTGGGGSSAPASPAVIATDTDGTATLTSWTLGATAGPNTLQAAATGLTGSPLTFTATGTTGTGTPVATQLAFTIQPSDAVHGAAISPAVQVEIRDAGGALVTGARDAVTLAVGINPGGGTLSGTTTVSAIGGIASFSGLSLDKVGTGYTLTATAPSLTGATSGTFNVTAGAATKLAFTVQPHNAPLGSPIAPAVQVAILDAAGNLVTTATASISVAIGTNPTGGTLSGTTTISAVGGVATFANLSILTSGLGYTLAASASGLSGTTSGAFDLVSAGNFACGVTTGGAAYCWGSNGLGQLGNGATANAATPVTVAGGLAFASLSGGPFVSCGVTTGGAAYCWGYNTFGQLGNGSATRGPTTPVAVAGGLTFASVSPGSGFACGVTTGGAGYCWGANGSGQLGNGSTISTTTPVPVAGGLTFASLTSGANHACGVTTGGAAYCWGLNSSGRLGNGSTTNSTTPVPVSGGLTFASVSADAHTCGVTTGGAAYCWGQNTFGELGNGSTTNSTTPVAVSGGLTFALVSPGAAYTCGVTTGGAAYCWGFNSSGRLGNGSTTSSTTPVPVSGGLTFASVNAGLNATCGVAAGAAYCWGLNTFGQLGNGSTTTSTIPMLVSGGLTFTSVSTQ